MANDVTKDTSPKSGKSNSLRNIMLKTRKPSLTRSESFRHHLILISSLSWFMNYIEEDTLEDIYLWRRKKLAFSVLFVSTAAWILINIYGFSSITIVSWAAMAIVSMVFLWGSLLRLLSKVEPDLSGLEVSDEFVAETVGSCRKLMEEMVRWMFRVGAESEWFVFARTILGFWILSRIGNLLDFHTFLFIGLVIGLTVPKLWEKNRDRLQKLSRSLKDRSNEAYDNCRDKIWKMKNKLQHRTEEKVKKAE